MTDPSAQKRSAVRRLAMVIVGGFAGVAAGLAAVYGIGAMQRNADPACGPSAELAKRLAPLARGEVAAITIAAEPKRLPDLAFNDAGTIVGISH